MSSAGEQQQQAPRPVITYASVTEANRRATVAMIWGVLSLAPVVFTGVMAIREGRRARVEAARTGTGAGRAWGAMALGVLGLVWSAVVLAAIPPAVIRARQQAQAVQCAANLRLLALNCAMYANANSGYLPPNLAALTALPPSCPGGSGAYVYLPQAQPIGAIKAPWAVPLAYEPLSNHGGRGINVAYVDGHVEYLQGAAAAMVIALGPTTQPATGQGR